MELTQLMNTLNSIRTRVRVFGVVFGAGLVIAGLISMLLVTLLADYLLNLRAWPRVMLLAGILGVTGYIVFRWIIKPLMARITLSDIAGRIEQVFPEFDDRLRSMIGFAEGKDVPGSEAMKRIVIKQAEMLAAQKDFSRAIETKPVWYSVASASAAMILVASIALMMSPNLFKIAISRVFTPFDAMSWPKTVQIALVGDVPRMVPVGTRVPIKIKLERGDNASRKPIVYYKSADGIEQSEFLRREEDGTYSATIDARTAADAGMGRLDVRVVAGDDERSLQSIQVVPRLAIRSVEVALTPPSYAKQPPKTVDVAAGPVLVTAGSLVELKIAFNKPLDSSKQIDLEGMKSSAAMDGMKWDLTGSQLAVARWTAAESTRFHIRATDSDGFANLGVEEYELIVRPDQLPLVQIENPRRNEERTPDAIIPLQAMAEDDFGIKQLDLVIMRLADKKEWRINLSKDGQWEPRDSSGDRKRFQIQYAWDLATLDKEPLKSGDVLDYHLSAVDNYDLGGKTHPPVLSGKLRIQIVSQEEFKRRIAEELRNAAFQIGEIKNNQQRTQRETENFKKDTQDKEKLDPADRAVIDRLAAQQSTAASQSKSIAGKMNQLQETMKENKVTDPELNTTAKDVAEMLENASEKPMKSATSKLNDAKDSKADKNDRNSSLDQAQQNQQESSNQLQKALDRMGNIGTLAQTIDKLQNILNDQQKLSDKTSEAGKSMLGKELDKLTPEQKKTLENIAREQQNLAKRTEEAIKEMNKNADSMSKSDPSSADAMKKAAETAQQQQVSQSQQNASKQASNNKQADAQASQKQAELGLQMALRALKEAERRKLEELAKKLAELQEQIATLIRRQASHNLDDLALQGPDRIGKLDTKELEKLLGQSGRTKETMPPAPTAPQLSSSQEQTERNARDIGSRAEAIPDSAETAAQITRAAERMQRAIVFLRDAKLIEAYDPPMVEALAALDEAKRIVDEKKKEADDKKQDQDRETIRAAFEKIRALQDKLNGETKTIETGRNPDGSLKRADAVRLGQLPGEQQKIADDAKKLDEGLSGAGSIIYIWANKDILKTMNEVKDALGRKETGVVTQAEQKRILDQLDAMIRNLSIKPKEQEFAEKSSGAPQGGGGAQPAPQLPSEAELRLLKDLQSAVNDSTKKIDAEAKKDAPQLLSLGGRQGELRGLLDQLLQKASRGQVKLGTEPDNKDQLPEEAKVQDVEDQELEQQLLGDKPNAEKIEKDARLVGDRMARSRQRLALNNDPGKTTQTIQERILIDLELLAQQAAKQQSQSSSSSGSGKPGEGQPMPQPGGNQQGKPQNAKGEGEGKEQQANSGQAPAGQSSEGAGGQSSADLSKDIQEKLSEWGKLTPRQRAAVIEGAGETVIEKYRKMVDDYYRTLATKATEKK